MPAVALRIAKITSLAQLRGLGLHARRATPTARERLREGAEPGAGLAWAKGPDPRDPVAAWRAHKAAAAAQERKGAPLCLQVLAGVPEDWIRAEGSLHDPDNPRNQALFGEARAWAESWAGEGAVFAARLDLDEAGGATAELLVAPVRDSRGRPVISTAKALKALQLALGERSEYAALHTSWAAWCQARLDGALRRGARKAIRRAAPDPAEHPVPDDPAPPLPRAVPASGADPFARLAALGLTGEADIQRARDWLLLLRECRAHQADPEGYAPPAGVLAFDPAMMEGSTHQPWPVIRAMSGGALEVLEAAHRLGLRVDDDRRRFAAGREVFPRYVDRVHIGAVLAQCGRICARAEALCKTAALREINGRRTPIDPELYWPHNSAETLARHVRRIRNMKRKAGAKDAPAEKAEEKPKPSGRGTAVRSKDALRQG